MTTINELTQAPQTPIEEIDVVDLTQETPFSISCPYPSCGGFRLEAYEFPLHAQGFHMDEPQHYACPICGLDGGPKFLPTDKTNLINHIQHIHKDLLTSSATQQHYEIGVPTEEEILEVTNNAYEETKSEYVVFAFHDSTSPECGICYDSISTGQQALRVSCFCLYHSECALEWFKKKGTNECPVHTSSS